VPVSGRGDNDDEEDDERPEHGRPPGNQPPQRNGATYLRGPKSYSGAERLAAS
jgi:hypothetical protein